ncbi:unnamed protein product [Withania somnifera]
MLLPTLSFLLNRNATYSWWNTVSSDWYNSEKSKRVKAFRCGKFDDFIQWTEASLGMPPKKREKYARWEDAILHALELERQVGKRCGSLVFSSTDRTNKSTYDSSGRESQTSSEHSKNGSGRRLRSKSLRTCNFSLIQESEDCNQYSGDDDNFDVPPRMRGLQDLGLSTAPSEHSSPPSIASDVNTERKSLSVKRKLSDEGLPEEILVKRRDRSCFLAQVLKSSENLPDSASVCISETGEQQPGVARKNTCCLAEEPTESLTVEEGNHAQMEFLILKRGDNGSYPAELCEQNAFGSAEYSESDSSETDSVEDTDDELATISELEPKYIGRSEAQPEHGSISSVELDEVTLADGASSHAYRLGPLSAGFGVSKWQLKGKRNCWSPYRRPLDPFDGNLARRPCHMTNFKGKRGYGCLPGYFDSVNSYHHSGRTLLVNVDLKVQSSFQREHIPMISLTSKINGQAIVGYPVRIEVLSNSTSETFLWATECNFPESSDNVTALQPIWSAARRTANVRIPRPHASSGLNNPEGIKDIHFDPNQNVQKASVGGVRTSARKSGKITYLKVRTLSSITLQQKRDDQKGSSNSRQVDGAVKRETLPTVIACIPVKLVFSRLSEELVGRHQ